MTYEGRKELHFRFLKLGRESPYAAEFAEVEADAAEKPETKKEKAARLKAEAKAAEAKGE